MAMLQNLPFFFLLTWKAHAVTYVHPDTSQCSVHGTALKCDFNFIEDEVVLDSLPEGGSRQPISAAYIYNVKKLTVPHPVCADLSFYNVDVIDFPFNHACQKKPINLRFVDSSANQVPRQLSRLEVTRSSIEKVVCDMGLQRVLLTSAQIGEFSAPWPIWGSYVIKIEHSTIDTFKALNIENQMFFSVLNSTFRKMSRQSLVLGRGASAVFLNSDVISEDDAIVIKGEAKLTIKDTTGKLSFMGTVPGKDIEFDRRPLGVPQEIMPPSPDLDSEGSKAYSSGDKSTCDNGPTWLWFVPTVVATLESLVIIVLCGKQVPDKKYLPPEMDFENPARSHDVSGSSFLYRDSSLNYYDENSKHYTTAFKRR